MAFFLKIITQDVKILYFNLNIEVLFIKKKLHKMKFIITKIVIKQNKTVYKIHTILLTLPLPLTCH